jgi:serine/threonine-protein kinase SRPK3
MSLRDLDLVFMKGRGFDEEFVKGAVTELLQALDFLHTEVQAVHTGKKPLYCGRLYPTEEEILAKIRI